MFCQAAMYRYQGKDIFMSFQHLSYEHLLQMKILESPFSNIAKLKNEHVKTFKHDDDIIIILCSKIFNIEIKKKIASHYSKLN